MLSFPVKFDRHHRPAPYPLCPYTLTFLHSETSLFSYSYLLPKFSLFVFNHLRTQVGRGEGLPSAIATHFDSTGTSLRNSNAQSPSSDARCSPLITVPLT